MDLIESLKLGTSAEIIITVVIVYVLTQAIKQTKINNRWLPWISMLIGIIAGLVSVLVTKDHNFSTAGVLGLLVGGFTSGLFDGFSGFLEKAEEDSAKIVGIIPNSKVKILSNESRGQNIQGTEIKDTINENGGTQNVDRSK